MMENIVHVEKMELKHLDAVHEIECNSFSIPWSKESMYKELTDNQLAIYIVAMENDKVIGYGGMWHVVTEGHITNIAVQEEYRNHGVGNMLLVRLIDIAYEKEMIGLTLEVRMNNAPAQKLYGRNGFKMEGIRKNYYSDTKEDAIVMWKNL